MSKAGRPKKGSAGLPTWFDIEKYRDVRKFSAGDWYHQLMVRKIVSAVTAAFGHNKGAIGSLAALIKEKPVLNKDIIHAWHQQAMSEKLEDWADYEEIYGGIMLIFNKQIFGITAPTNHEIYDAYTSFPAEVQDYLNSDNLDHIGGDPDYLIDRAKPIEQFMDTTYFLEQKYGKSSRTLMVVDFGLPDEVLFKQFEAYVKDKRKEHQRPNCPFFKNPDFQDWYNLGCLPYLDLSLDDEASSTTFRWSDFAEAVNSIADKPVGSESALSKTTKKTAEHLLSDEVIRILQTQSACEQAGLIKESGKLVVR